VNPRYTRDWRVHIETLLPEFRKAELYVIVAPDPTDPGKQVFLMVPSPDKDRVRFWPIADFAAGRNRPRR